MKARLGESGNGGGEWSFSKCHLKQRHPPLFPGDLKLGTGNEFLRKEEQWVPQGGAAIATTELDKCINSAWQLMNPEVYIWFTHWICQQGVTVNPPADSSDAPVT